MKLSELKTGESGVISKVMGRGAFRKRLTEMGFVKGKEITVVKNAPLKDPIEYSILGYEVSLRRKESALIEVITIDEAKTILEQNFNGVITEELLKTTAKEHSRTIDIVLVGNPNCGKTTLFNQATGSHEHVGNYAGVTVDAKKAKLKLNGYTLNIIDLPGTYSISAYTPEEVYVRNYILEQSPDLVINVVDASNLERNLYLTTQLIDMDIKVVLALNMYDELQKHGHLFEHEKLGKLIGIPIVPTIGSSGFGIDTLFEKAIEVYEDRDPTVRHIHIHYGHELEKALRKLQAQLRTENNLQTLISSRYLAINLLQDRKRTLTLLETNPNLNGVLAELDRQKARLKELFEETTDQLVTDAKYGFIAGALKETYTANELDKLQTTKIIDTVLTHKFWGFPIFFGFMWFMFQVTFSLGSYPMDWLDAVVGFVAEGFGTYMPDGVLKDLIVDGIIGGVGGVIVFLPNILLLFFFISLMEDTGYMARAAFIMDRVMHKFGLHGKSFIPLIMGFGCNVPAVMASRTLENKNERLLTMLINPFMSCSARLPVYVLIVAAVFPKNAGTVLFSIYILGIVLAAMVAMLFSKTLFRNTEAPFVMELPPYRIPTLKSTVRHMWHKAAQYLQKMGGVILIASILIWAMSYYPRSSENTASYTAEYTQVSSTYTQQEKLLSGAPLDTLLLHKEAALAELQLKIDADRQQNSYIGQMGKTLSPLLAPLGFDWKMTVSIITGMAAKEIVVSTMGVLYQADENADENSQTLITKIKHNKFDTGVYKGENTFTPVRAYAFMVFVLIYFPCIAVIAAVRKESGSGKWALFLAVYTTVLAWVLAFIINYLGKFF